MSKKILMCGNEALAEASIIAGLDAYFGYPITPQNEITAYMARRMPEEGRVFLQSESELAAINMVFGAAATGARVMTSSSSPGISLMQEGISYIAGAELPCVIVNIMRGGPGLGNIAPSQCDYFQATRGGGHGDYRTIVLAPASVQEMVDLQQLAFDLADQYRIPVMLLGDGTLGQMMEPIELAPIESNRTLPPKPWALTGPKDRDSHVIRTLWMEPAVLEARNRHLQQKYAEIEKSETLYEEYDTDDADIILIAYGLSSRIVRGAVKQARDKGIRAGWIRPISLWPFPSHVISLAAEQKQRIFFVVEMSEGQMVEDVRLAVNGKARVHFLGRSGGSIPTIEQVLHQIEMMPNPSETEFD